MGQRLPSSATPIVSKTLTTDRLFGRPIDRTQTGHQTFRFELCCLFHWRAQGESNPCFRRERGITAIFPHSCEQSRTRPPYNYVIFRPCLFAKVRLHHFRIFSVRNLSMPRTVKNIKNETSSDRRRVWWLGAAG